MVTHTCDTCQKTFSTKQRLKTHGERKTPCQPPPICNDKMSVSFVLQGISYETLINLIGSNKIISSTYVNMSKGDDVKQPLNIVKQPLNIVKPIEPTEPTEPTEPIEPTEPTEPIEPIEPTEPIEPIEQLDNTTPLNNVKQPLNNVKQPSNKIKQCVRMRNIKLINPITSYIDFSTDKVLSRCIKSKNIHKMPNGKVLERAKDTMKSQIQPLIMSYFCSFKGEKRITKNNKGNYLYNNVKLPKNKLMDEMINLTIWALLDYRQENDKTVYDDVDDLVAKLTNMTSSDTKIIFDLIDNRL